MKRRGARRTTVSLDKQRLSSPISPSITHPRWTPSFTAHSPTHPTGDGEAGGRPACSAFFLIIIFFFYSLSFHFPPHSRLLSFSVPHLLLFPPPLASLSLPLSLSHYLSLLPCFLFPLHLGSLSSQQLLLCQNEAKFNTSVDGEEKAVLCPSAPQLFSFFSSFFFFFFNEFSSGLGVPQITFPRTWQKHRNMYSWAQLQKISDTNHWQRRAHKCKMYPTNNE